LVTAREDRTIRLWNARTGQALHILSGHTRNVVSVAMSMEGGRLASTGGDGAIKVWDGLTGQEQLSLHGAATGETVVAISPDGRHLASGGSEGVRLWYGGAPPEAFVLRGHTRKIELVAFSPDSSKLV